MKYKENNSTTSQRWFIILALIFFPPVGLFFMWKHQKSNQNIRIILSVIGVIWTFMLFASATANSSTEFNNLKLEYERLEGEYNTLQNSHEKLRLDNDGLLEINNELGGTYNNLEEINNELIKENTELKEKIKELEAKKEEAPAAEPEASASTASQEQNITTAYWTPGGKSYHLNEDCATLKRSSTIDSGTIDQAILNGKDDPCNVCSNG